MLEVIKYSSVSEDPTRWGTVVMSFPQERCFYWGRVKICSRGGIPRKMEKGGVSNCYRDTGKKAGCLCITGVSGTHGASSPEKNQGGGKKWGTRKVNRKKISETWARVRYLARTSMGRYRQTMFAQWRTRIGSEVRVGLSTKYDIGKTEWLSTEESLTNSGILGGYGMGIGRGPKGP